jgi:hypothetical protein
MSNDLQKPGEIPNSPGEYKETGPQGGKLDKGKQVTIEPGDKPLPPTSKSGNKWKKIGPPKK